ncbi:MAG: hypothetical protein LBP23_04995 [Treponema sp.]|jgi:hypothetical protein|nr:hypothetical protein [Treponema sp.]
MSRNKLSDLNDHLFEQMEWLGDRDLKGEDLKEEILRAQAKCNVAGQIIANGRLMLEAAKAADMIPGIKKMPLLLE